MAHFAELNANNIVTRVVVVNNDVIKVDGAENEQAGVDFLISLYGDSTWKQTSYNATFRKNYAGKGYTYDSDKDAFIPPKFYPSWTLVEDTCQWEAPVTYPDVAEGEETYYKWDEDTKSWVEVE